MNRYPWIILIAAGILGEVAGKMILHDPALVRQVGATPFWAEILVRLALAAVVILIGWAVMRKRGAKHAAR